MRKQDWGELTSHCCPGMGVGEQFRAELSMGDSGGWPPTLVACTSLQALLSHWDTLSVIQRSSTPAVYPVFLFRAMETAVCVMPFYIPGRMQTPEGGEEEDRAQPKGRFGAPSCGSLFLTIRLGHRAYYQGSAPLDPGSWPPTGSQHLPVFTLPDP